jgi:lysophospholipase L1-like esterase
MNFLTLSLLRLTLAPILLWQSKRTRVQTIKLPEASGDRSGVVSDYDHKTTFKLLVIGDSSAAGVGAGMQSEALSYQTAAALAQQLERPVAWQLIAQSGLNTAQAHAFFCESNASTADVVLFALGVNDATSQVKANAFIANTTALLQTVIAKTGARIAVFSGLPPVHDFPALPQPLRFYLGSWSKWLDASLQAWTRQQGHIFCAIEDTLSQASVADMASDGYHPGPRIYQAWGKQAAKLISSKVLGKVSA